MLANYTPLKRERNINIPRQFLQRHKFALGLAVCESHLTTPLRCCIFNNASRDFKTLGKWTGIFP